MTTKLLYLLTIIYLLEIIATPQISAEQVRNNSDSVKTKSGPNAREDQNEEFRLLRILEKHTELATKNRINADFVPGMVTVLYGDDLEARGVKTLKEALSLVPGMNVYFIRQGFWMSSVRGASEIVTSGNLKILIDGVPFNKAFATDAVPNIPVEQVERIDVIRGPGSAIHGEFACAGVVDIITRKNENRLFANLGSFETYGAGGVFSWADPKKDLSMTLNLSGWKTDGADIISGPDTLHGQGMKDISYAPGPTNEKVEHESGFFSFVYKDFSLNAQLLKNGQGDFFGMNYALPPPDDRIIYRSNQMGLEARQEVDIFSVLHAKFNLGTQRQEFEANNNYLYPPGYYLPFPSGVRITYPAGWLYSIHYEEDLFHGGVDLTWEAWNRHTFLLGYFFSRIEVNDVWYETNFDMESSIPFPMPTTRHDGSKLGFPDGLHRDIHSITMQDVLQINDKLTFTGSLRYDHYSDIGDTFSPRLAAVYRLNRHHILKTQYARAFRPPFFWEMYSLTKNVGAGNPDLRPETNDTYELGYIYKDVNTVFRTTLFYSILNDVIYNDISQHKNSDRNNYFQGMELEIERQLGHSLKLDANLSHVHAQDAATVPEGAQAASWLANIGLMYQPNSLFNLALQYRYVSDRNREQADPRENLGAYHTVDITGSLFNLGFKGLILRAGIKNLFDEDVRYPAPLEEFSFFGRRYPTYPEDFPRPGRQWWCQITCKF
jgi:iron complex outermembrane receptor protein